jgi:hypothetical protein
MTEECITPLRPAHDRGQERPGIVTPLRACGPAGGSVAKGMKKISYRGYRFPPEIIQQAIWLYLRFTLSLRDVEDLLAERGIMVSYETVRRWVNHFGPVRRQSFWDKERLKLRESLARLICNVMRPADGAASGDWRLSVV